jgi:uncharacterized protein (TIGR00369 family)
LVSVSATEAVGRYPVAGNTQPHGLWHGGASAVAAETLASLAASVEVGPSGSARGVNVAVNHLRPASSGWVTVRATALRLGQTLAVYGVTLHRDDGEQLADARVTVSLRR